MSSYDSDFERALFEDARARFSVLRNEFATDEDYITGDAYRQKLIPADVEDSGFEPTMPPTTYDAVENATNHILTTPRARVPVRPTTKDVEQQRENAENRQSFHDMWWHRVFEDQGDPLRRVTKSLVKGKGVLKLELRWDLLPDPETMPKDKFRAAVQKAGRHRFLWSMRVVPKETVYELGDPWDPDGVYEAYDILVMDARSRWPTHGRLMAELEGKQPLDTISYIEYWSKPKGSDPGKFIQWVETERVHEAENPYAWETPLSTEDKPDYDGRLPYIIGDPGWGDVDAKARPEDRYVSLIRPIRSVAIAEARWLTSLDAWLRVYVWPVIKSYNGAAIDREGNPRKIGPGEVWDLHRTGDESDQDVEVMPWGDAPVTLLQGQSRVNAIIDSSTKFGSLGGVPQRGVDTATEADMNVRNAQAKLAGIVSALQRMVVVANRYVLQDIEKVLEVPVTLYGAIAHGPSEVTVKPRDINGYWYTEVELGTTDEAALNLRNARTWADLTSVLPVSFRTAMEKAGIPNPTAEIDERMLENLEQSPQAMQLMLGMLVSAFQSDIARVVQEGFRQSVLRGEAGQANTSRPDFLPAQANGNVEAMRQTTRDEAITNSPERSMF